MSRRLHVVALSKEDVQRLLQYIIEKKRYSISANVAGAMIAQNSPRLAPAWRSVLFYHYPFMLGSAAEDHYAWALPRLCREL